MPRRPARIPTIHFGEALGLLGRDESDASDEPDLSPSDERWLGEWAQRTFQSDFLFVEGYPMAARPFYTHPGKGSARYSNSFDLLFRGQEIVTGGQRLHRLEDYEKALAARGMSRAGIAGYLKAFQYGMPPHGGFAIGLERITARLLGLPNIRMASLFPRDRNRLEP
jgi:nondiscriminating aspartyl-tRNA synthetase